VNNIVMSAPELTPERLSEIRFILGISAILVALIASPFIASWYFERKNKITQSAHQFYCHRCRRGTNWNDDRTLCLECSPSSTPADHQDECPPDA